MASCCAKTASSSTTARRRGSRDDHFFMTTTTANAARVMTHMEFCHQALWPELDVQYVSVTEQWAQMAVAGPKARATLQKIVDDVDAQRHDLPLSRGEGDLAFWAASPARLFRISFSGEHAYELSVPADYGNMVARALMQAGEEFGIAPYGVEALSVMRIEKGHVAGGELNGTTTAADLGLGTHDVDQEGLYRPHDGGARRPGRPRTARCVVGIRPVDKADRIRAGSHLLKRDDPPSLAERSGLCHVGRLFADARACGWAWRSSRTGASGMARSSRCSTGCATSTCMPRSAIPCITTRRTGSSMPRARIDRSASRRWPMSRVQGRFGADKGAPGVTLSVRHPVSIVTIIARKGQAEALGAGDRSGLRHARCPAPAISTARARSPSTGAAPINGMRWPRAGRRRALSRAQSAARGPRLLLGPEPWPGHPAHLPAQGARACWPRERRSISIRSVFGPASAAVTQMAHVGVHLTRTGEDAFELSVFRGFSENFWEWLTSRRKSSAIRSSRSTSLFPPRRRSGDGKSGAAPGGVPRKFGEQ